MNVKVIQLTEVKSISVQCIDTLIKVYDKEEGVLNDALFEYVIRETERAITLLIGLPNPIF